MEGWFVDLRWGLAKKEGVVFLRGWGLIPTTQPNICKKQKQKQITQEFALNLHE